MVLQLLRSYPAAAPSFLPSLLPALVTKVASPGSSPVLISELLVVVTVLARADAGQLVNMLASLTCSLPGEQGGWAAGVEARVLYWGAPHWLQGGC